MDSVVLDGVEYVKAAVVAKRFKYTSDYVGQLCRAKKIDARLVGRSWFVSPNSLTKYKKDKHTKPEEKEAQTPIKFDEAVKSSQAKLSVQPVIKSKTFKAFADAASSLPDTGERKLRVSYERDEENLMPIIHRKYTKPSKRIRVEVAGAKKVKVEGAKKLFTFEADEIPAFALSGKVVVSPLPEAQLEEITPEDEKKVENNHKSIVKSDKQTLLKHDGLITMARKETPDKAAHKVKINQIRSAETDAVNAEQTEKLAQVRKKSQVFLSNALETKKPEDQKSSGNSTKPQFTPSLVKKTQPTKSSVAILISPLLATVSATLIALVLFAASNAIYVSDNKFESKIVFKTQNISDILDY